MTVTAKELAAEVGGSVIDTGQIWARTDRSGLTGAARSGCGGMSMRSWSSWATSTTPSPNSGAANNEAIAARADLCAPWCDEADGHPDAYPSTRACWLFGEDVALSLYPELEWSDGTMRPGHLQTLLRRRGGDAPEIRVSYEGETPKESFEHRLGISDAKALAAELVRLAELAGGEDDDE